MHPGATDVVGAGTKPDFTRSLCIVEVTDRSGPAGNIRFRQKCAQAGVKTDQPIGCAASFDNPYSIIAIDGHAKRPAVFAAWHRPLGELSVLWIVAAENAEFMVWSSSLEREAGQPAQFLAAGRSD